MAHGFDGDEGAAQHIGAARPGVDRGDPRQGGAFKCGLHGFKAVDGPQLGAYDVIDFIIVGSLIADAIAIHAQVAVGVDEAGVNEKPLGIHHPSTCGGLDALGNALDFPLFYQDVGHKAFFLDPIVNLSAFD